ncbi:MAG: energy transducer TonB [Crocinitomicaceae bacterium]|nr:energy transducer TonB [Crocinitomicaceae bacterium]MDG1776585.1 energy transducer TonB [Crocinitomicaceae bacterium]
MELKKSEQANIEKLRVPITLMGLLFVGSIVLASFSYQEGIKRELRASVEENSADIQFMQDAQEQETPPPPPPAVDVPPPVTEEIVEEENTEEEPVPVAQVPPPVDIAPEVVVVEEEIIDFPDVEAGFPGGAAAMQQWIADNVQYPQTAIEMNEQGRVYLSFVVESNGTIGGIKIERGVSIDLDREAKRLLRRMPKWVAGEAKGRKVRTRCRLPINFTLN